MVEGVILVTTPAPAVAEPDDPDDLSAAKDVGPTQPSLSRFPQTLICGQNRAFSLSLNKRFPFIEYSVKLDAVYCFSCRHFGNTTSTDLVFTKRGYRNWKRCYTALTKHSGSDSHLQATALWDAWRSSEKTGTVAGKIEDHANNIIELNRNVVQTLARIGIFCGKQELALRGHRESCNEPFSNKGNFLSLVQLIELENLTFKDKLQTLPRNARYM